MDEAAKRLSVKHKSSVFYSSLIVYPYPQVFCMDPVLAP